MRGDNKANIFPVTDSQADSSQAPQLSDTGGATQDTHLAGNLNQGTVVWLQTGQLEDGVIPQHLKWPA